MSQSSDLLKHGKKSEIICRKDRGDRARQGGGEINPSGWRLIAVQSISCAAVIIIIKY